MARKTLTGLLPQSYEHPLDTQALNALERTPGLETMVRKLNEWGFERLISVQLTGSNLRVNADNFPELHDMLRAACQILDVPRTPDLYIAAGGEINAFTAGIKRTIIVLTSATVDLLTDEELFFVLAHEVGHIKSGHVLYSQMADFFPAIGEIIGAATFGIGGLVNAGLQIALLNWKRMAEFTADRAGLLACQNIDAAIATMMKIAGLPQKRYGAINTEDFVAQAKEFDALDTDKLNKFAKVLSVMGQAHPWTVMRANQFLTWVDNGAYQMVLDAPAGPVRLPPSGVVRYCTECGRGLAGTESFCPRCGVKQLAPA